MKKRIMIVFGILLALFILIQFVPYGHDHTNPPVISTPNWDSAQTEALARRACYDCHSNETTWPWYSNIAPVSWLIQRDVEQGRRIVNLSDWANAKDFVNGMANQALSGRMPPLQYTIIHSTANLSSAERQQLAQGFKATGAR